MFGDDELRTAAFFHLSKQSPLLNPKLLKFPKTRIIISKPHVDVHVDADDVMLVISDQLKELKQGQKNLVAGQADVQKQNTQLAQQNTQLVRDITQLKQGSTDLKQQIKQLKLKDSQRARQFKLVELELSESKKGKRDKHHLMCFSQVARKFVKDLYLRPLDFPPGFYDKLEYDVGLREEVDAIGATLGIKADQILEWVPLIEGRDAVAHPQVTKAEFIAAVHEFIALKWISKSSADVFLKIYDVVKPARTRASRAPSTAPPSTGL